MAASCAPTLIYNSFGTCTKVQAMREKGDVRLMCYGFSYRSLPKLDAGNSSRNNFGMLSTRGRTKFWPPSYVKASHTRLAVASDRFTSESDSQGEVADGNQNGAFFPDGFESLITEICDETDVAEIKLKAGTFEMHMRRNIEKSNGLPSVTSPLTAPPIPSKPMVDSDPTVITLAPSSNSPTPPPTGSSNPFTNKLADVASDEGFLLVTSPQVGIFRKSRVGKGKVGPVMCPEGKVIKEGQVVGYVDQIGAQIPILSKVSGEIVKVILKDGDAVGYNDPVIAVLPSFHGIRGLK